MPGKPERVVDALDVDVGADAGLAGDRQVGHELADYVIGGVVEAGVVWIPAQLPAEDASGPPEIARPRVAKG